MAFTLETALILVTFVPYWLQIWQKFTYVSSSGIGIGGSGSSLNQDLRGPTVQRAPELCDMGLLDQRQVLRWIQYYICCFDGDLDYVTLFGETVTAPTVTRHLFMRESYILFHSVILGCYALRYASVLVFRLNNDARCVRKRRSVWSDGQTAEKLVR
jgi:Carboxylesterase family